jgi:hypothetical protein
MTDDPQTPEPDAQPVIGAGTSDAGEPVDLEDLVDDLELKVASEAGNPLEKIADAASSDGTDRPGHDAEPPA